MRFFSGCRRLAAPFAALLMSVLPCVPVGAAEMTFQLVNNTDRAMNLKLFSRGESKQVWPGQTRAYSLRPDAAVQQLKIDCTEGESICWGAWEKLVSEKGEIGNSGRRTTHHISVQTGVGERGTRDCKNCCHICQNGFVVPPVGVKMSSDTGVDVK